MSWESNQESESWDNQESESWSQWRDPVFEEWCRQEGLEASLSSWVAYTVLVREPLPFSLPWEERRDVWEELVQWRYPQLNLNLLQLSVILGRNSAAVALWQHPFLQEESYTDESSKLVNHPLHLVLTIRPEMFDNISRRCHVMAEVYSKEGTVDLTSAMLRMPHSRTRLVEICVNSPSAQEASTDVSDSQSRAAQNPLRELIERYGSSGRSNPFHDLDTRIDFTHLRQLDKDTMERVTSHFKTQLNLGACASTAELLWPVVEALSSQGIRIHFYLGTFVFLGFEMYGEVGEEFLILACQLYWAVSKNDSELLCLDSGIAETMATAVKRGMNIQRAVRYLPNETVLRIFGCFQLKAEREAMFRRSRNSQMYSAAAENLRSMLQQRTLQDHCVLSILKAVRGDAKRVWSMTDYPEVLRKKFDVPFQKLQWSR